MKEKIDNISKLSKVNSKENNSFFIKLSGTQKLKDQIINNWSEDEIRFSWINDLKNFKNIRSKYLLY